MLKHYALRFAICLAILAVSSADRCTAQSLEMPGPEPGVARATVDGDRLALENDVLACRWSLADGRLVPVELADKITSTQLSLDDGRSECFRLRLDDGPLVAASQMRPAGPARVETIEPDAGASRLAARFAGKRIVVPLKLPEADHQDVSVDWQVELRDGSNYVRQSVAVRPAGRTVEVKRLVLIDLACDTAAEANVIGTVPGSPIVMRPFFFAYEHANSRAMVSRGDNVALGKPATANGVWGDLVPELAFDGQRADGNRHWGCANLPVWLQVDLEQTVPIDRVHLFTWFNDRRIYKYKIETSTDGEHWQTAVDRTGESRPATSAGYDERFPERPARLVRVTFTENSEGNQFGGHVVEMEVFRSRAENVEPAERLVCSLVRNETLPAARTLVQSSVIGVVPPGQLRRGFLYYVERERAHPFRPFLHYNSWYDTSWPGHAMHEAECLEVVEIFRRELIEGRGVKLECFLWDDGWDDPRTLWRIDKTRFPRGFAPLLAATEAAGAKQGFWLSPWGGYGEAKRQRVAMGKEKGFETDGGGFSIAGPKYFERFLDASRRMIDENGCNHFKYDGMNAARIEQSAAMFRLIAQLRQLQPDLFVNMTVGTWPSVYYLWHGDSTWRGAGDMGHAGKGPKREQWVTYRDLHTYHGVVRRGPLYPLNSLMTQGIAHARFGHPTANGKDRGQLRNEIRSFFASGTATQELYITPQMMTADNWDDLAEAARWSAANADVLVDTHWIGGDPAKDEIYGWASWSPRKGILALRNPSDRPAEIAIDVARAFELPSGASRKYVLKSPWEDEADRKTATVEAGDEHMFSLEPFEVLVFDATPVAE